MTAGRERRGQPRAQEEHGPHAERLSEHGREDQPEDLLQAFWEAHDPTQGMRQGGDTGTQYRSGVYYFDQQQREAAERSRDQYQLALARAGYGRITTEIVPAPEFYYAEDYHQQYLAKNPNGYCGHGGTGVSCPVGTRI